LLCILASWTYWCYVTAQDGCDTIYVTMVLRSTDLFLSILCNNTIVPNTYIGQAYYRLAEVDMASNHFSQCLKHDPEHASCKMWFKKCRAISKKVTAGDHASNASMYTEAVTAWQDAVALDSQHVLHVVPLHVKIAQALALLQQWSDSIVAAEAALRLDANNKVSLGT
jgi:tetratricopeptide (TPR) repeat protein